MLLLFALHKGFSKTIGKLNMKEKLAKHRFGKKLKKSNLDYLLFRLS